MRRLLVTASLALALLAGTARAQDPPPPPQAPTKSDPGHDQKKELRRRIQAMRLARLTQELDLDEATAAKVFPLVNRHDEKVSALMEDRAKTITELAGAVQANKEDAVGPILDKLDAIEKGVHEADETTHKKLREALTPMQSAKFVLFHEKFEGEIREMLGDAHRDGDRDEIIRAKKMAEAKAMAMKARGMTDAGGAKGLLEKAAVLLKKGAPLDAAKLATMSLEADPANVSAYMIRAQAHAQLGDFAAALADVDRALALDPSSVDFHAFRAHLRLAIDDVEGARGEAEWMTKTLPDQPQSWATRGMVHMHAKEFADAVKDLSHAIEIKKAPDFFRFRGDARAHLGQPVEAIEDYKKFIELAPESPDAAMVKKKIAELEPK